MASAATTGAGLGLLFAAAAAMGLAVLVLLFKSGLMSSIEILFYRGLVLCAVAVPVTAALVYGLLRVARFEASAREVISAAALSLGVNLSVLVILPVTVDRSVSVFVLGYMNAHRDRALTPEEVDAGFRRIYLDHLAQIDRRLKEQTQSGNLVEEGGRYRISEQGKAFMTTAAWVAWAFDTDRRLIERRPEEEGGVAAHPVEASPALR
jgi:hypothetical protein